MIRISICGHGRCGKDTAAEYLSTITPLRYVAGTSYWARHIVFSRLPWYLRLWYWTPERAWKHRHKRRMFWAKCIGEYNRDDPVKLYRDCLADQEILTGIRWKSEQAACRRAGIADLWVWIDRPGITIDPTMTFGQEDCDVAIVNDGTLEDFHAKLRDFASQLGILNQPIGAAA